MTETGIILLVFVACLIAAVIALVCCAIIYKKHLKIVKENSEYYAEVLKLNGSYEFYSNFSSVYKYHETCASKRKLENLSLVDVLLSRIDCNFTFYEYLISQVKKNRKNYESYYEKYKCLCSTITEDKIKGLKIKLSAFLKIERGLCEKSKLTPQLSTSVYIRASYTSPKGRNSYSKERTFTYDELVIAFNQYLALKKQQKDYSYQVKVERAKMTDSLRYDILKRDNFMCQLCGATAQEGAKLHVDHIVPVAKGGKTIASNLRTLCDRCNMGKSDKIE
ncbi:MAG: HNH endonuclease [Clostridiales bacterium]|nr:HNH endonuclease [Clostridiales bacterium]